MPGIVVGGSDLLCRGLVHQVAEVHLRQPGTELRPALPRRRNAVLVDLGPGLERRLTLMRGERVRVIPTEWEVHFGESTARPDDGDAGFDSVQHLVAVTALEAEAVRFVIEYARGGIRMTLICRNRVTQFTGTSTTVARMSLPPAIHSRT